MLMFQADIAVISKTEILPTIVSLRRHCFFEQVEPWFSERLTADLALPNPLLTRKQRPVLFLDRVAPIPCLAHRKYPIHPITPAGIRWPPYASYRNRPPETRFVKSPNTDNAGLSHEGEAGKGGKVVLAIIADWCMTAYTASGTLPLHQSYSGHTLDLVHQEGPTSCLSRNGRHSVSAGSSVAGEGAGNDSATEKRGGNEFRRGWRKQEN